MNKLPLLLLPALVAVGCQRPEVEAFRKAPPPIVVQVTLADDLPGSEDLTREYAAALRARLATRATVVPEGVEPPPGAAKLQVNLTLRAQRGDPTPGAVGVATGLAVGTLSAMFGNRDAVFDGLFWGMWAGANAAAAQRYDRGRLGYRPYTVDASVYLNQPIPGRKEWATLADFGVRSREVMDAMGPLGPGQRYDEERIREEVGRGLARAIVRHLDEEIEWIPKARPSY